MRHDHLVSNQLKKKNKTMEDPKMIQNLKLAAKNFKIIMITMFQKNRRKDREDI